jgi:predicted dehydrogenase
MRMLVAGTGSIGQRHIRNLRELDSRAEFVLLRADGREDALSRELGAPVVRTLGQGLEHAPDALLLATPSALHAELLLPAIAAGLPMYVEKPVVTDRTHLESVRAALAARDYRATTLVGCNLRFLPSLRRLRHLLLSGVIGRVARASFEAGQWLPDWRPSQDHRQSYSADPTRGGGVVLDLVHEIDAARWLLGDFTRVAAMTTQVPALEISSEAVACALLSAGPRGPLATIALDYVARRPLRRYQLVGERGTLVWDLPARTLHLDNTEGREVIDCGEGGFDVAATYPSAMEEFLVALASGTPTTQPIEEGLASAELAIRIKEQACSP